MNYEEKIDELIDKKLKAALEALEKQRAQTAASYDAKRSAAKAEEQTLTRGAYADYAKNIDPTGYNAEALAAMGLGQSGKSETAKVGYYNVYQNALADIRSKTAEEMASLSEQEQKALIALDEADTKARDNAYTLLLEEQVRRQEAEREQAEADRQYQLKVAAQALKEQTAAKSSSKSSSSSKKSNATTTAAVTGYPTDGTDNEKYKWLKSQLEFLAWSVAPGEDNPRPRILASAQKYLDLAKQELDDEYYLKLLEIVG